MTSVVYHVLPLCYIYINITWNYDDIWCVSRFAILLYIHKHHLWWRCHLFVSRAAIELYMYINITCGYDDILCASRATVLPYIHKHHLWLRWHLLCITCCHCAIYIHKYHLWLRWHLLCITCCHCAICTLISLEITMTSGVYHVLPFCYIYINITCD
jgi:hypothetical protein